MSTFTAKDFVSETDIDRSVLNSIADLTKEEMDKCYIPVWRVYAKAMPYSEFCEIPKPNRLDYVIEDDFGWWRRFVPECRELIENYVAKGIDPIVVVLSLDKDTSG